jgi:hypothetical protein
VSSATNAIVGPWLVGVSAGFADANAALRADVQMWDDRLLLHAVTLVCFVCFVL